MVVPSQLRDPGDSRSHGVPPIVAGHFSPEYVDKYGPFGPGAYKTHVAREHVQKLGQFVDMQCTYRPAATQHAPVIDFSQYRPVLLGITSHSAQLQEQKELAIAPDALLPVDERTPVLQTNRQSRDYKNWESNEEQDRRECQIKKAKREYPAEAENAPPKYSPLDAPHLPTITRTGHPQP